VVIILRYTYIRALFVTRQPYWYFYCSRSIREQLPREIDMFRSVPPVNDRPLILTPAGCCILSVVLKFAVQKGRRWSCFYCSFSNVKHTTSWGRGGGRSVVPPVLMRLSFLACHSLQRRHRPWNQFCFLVCVCVCVCTCIRAWMPGVLSDSVIIVVFVLL
jgi:hypothetical protein